MNAAKVRAAVQVGEQLEAKYDAQLGGRETRSYRELLCYCASRLVLAGGQVSDVLAYLEDVLTVGGPLLVEAIEAAPDCAGGPEGSS